MKAAVLYEPRKPLVIENLRLDPPQAGEVRVRVAANGVCHSDLHVMTGDMRMPLPIVLGHEGAGIVAEVGPGVPRCVRETMWCSPFSPSAALATPARRGVPTCVRRAQRPWAC